MASPFGWWQALGDRRTGMRNATRQSAFIDFDDSTGRHSCIISDISESGARLMIPSDAAIPEEFTLLVPHRCRIVRRMNGQVGVRFVDAL